MRYNTHWGAQGLTTHWFGRCNPIEKEICSQSGSGKSSLLKTLYGDLPLRKGVGNIAGFDLSTLKEKEIPYLRRKLGVVFQDFQLLTDRSVSENLYFVLSATGWKDKKKIHQSEGNTTTYTNLLSWVLVRLFVVMQSLRLPMDSFSADSNIDPFAFKTTRGPTFFVIKTLPPKTR